MSQTQKIAFDMLQKKYPDKFLLNKAETADSIGEVSIATLDRLTKAGEIPFKKIGGQVFYKIDEVAEYIADN